MRLPNEIKIAGDKTVGDWFSIRPRLTDFSDNEIWEGIFTDYFLGRLEDRYLRPIKFIEQNGNESGEGFSIMTIICSLIEFLETTYEGTNYRFRKKGDPPLTSYEYDKSGSIFISFLTTKEPFLKYFNADLATDFYSKVRCGLLHEARTNGSWIIRVRPSSERLIEQIGDKKIIFRDKFFESVTCYIKHDYKAQLLSSIDRKLAFLRKYDRLCEE